MTVYLVVQQIDIAAAHGNDKIPAPPVSFQIRFRIIKGGSLYGVNAVSAHTIHQHAAVQVAQVGFTGSADIGHKGLIGLFCTGQVLIKSVLTLLKVCGCITAQSLPLQRFRAMETAFRISAGLWP